jgi:hypothetical protein
MLPRELKNRDLVKIVCVVLRQVLTMQPRLAFNLQSSSLSLPKAGITGVSHYTQLRSLF